MIEIQNPRVKVINKKDGWLGTEYYINGQKIDFVKYVDFRVAVDEIPTFTFEMTGLPDIDMSGNVQFDFTPKTVQDAVKVLQNELSKHGDVYNAFCASILSTLEENNQMLRKDLSRKILDRIIGKE